MANKKISEREHIILKRTMSLILAMLVGVGGVPLTKTQKIHAAANSNLAREVWQTPDELADGTYNTSGSGQAGYIIFGTRPEVKYHNGSGESTASAGPIKWLIVGKDTDDNIVLYSEEPLMSARMYDSSSNSIFDPFVGSPYRKTDSTYGEVYTNHYGASNFRKNLQSIAGNTSYFKSAEQGLMLNTTVKTQDAFSGDEYETEDKLYGLHSENFGSSYTNIYAGANNSLSVNIKYWKGYHWLRSPDQSSNYCVFVAYPSSYCPWLLCRLQ